MKATRTATYRRSEGRAAPRLQAGSASRPICRAFPGRPEQVGIVREFVERRLPDACPRAARHDISLCVSEVTTNAIKYTYSGKPTGCFLVGLQVSPESHSVRLEVHDGGSLPELDGRHEYEYDEGGHGLVLVSALCESMARETTKYGGLTWFVYRWESWPNE